MENRPIGIDMTKSFLNWLGGFFDGEGSAGCYHFKGAGVPFTQLKITLRQKDEKILNLVKETLGYGSVCHDYKKKGMYGWYCSSANGRKFLKLILPYLRTDHKRSQVKEALRKDKQLITPN